MEYTRWMVEMHTRLTGSIWPDCNSWTLYSSVNFRFSSGVVNPWNSRRVWRPKLLRSTRNSTRFAPVCLMRRYTKLQAVKVLPLLVAIWINARGFANASDSSKLRMARACTGQRPPASNGGISVRRWRKFCATEYAAIGSATPAALASAVVAFDPTQSGLSAFQAA